MSGSISVRTSGGDGPEAPKPATRGASQQLLADGAGRVTQNAVSRTLSNIAIGPVRTVERRKAARKNMAVQEMELQYQVEFSGEATDLVAWESFSLDFDYKFHYAPSARDSDLDRPQFLHGVVIDGGSPVMVTVCVTEWAVDVDEATTGATLAVGTCAPGVTDQLVPFSGYLHLTFQGYGGVLEDETDL